MISTIVGFAISMAFLFLMLSAACSAVQEIIANLLRWRAKTLEMGLGGLLLSDKFRDEVYDQPLIKGLYAPVKFRKGLQRPAYIPPTTLALAVLQAADKHKLQISGTAAVSSADFKETEELLASLLRDCTNAEQQRKRIESWFNDSMDRVSGWYKRKSHAWIWVFGIALSLLLNADAITLSKRFWSDQPLRDAIVAEATEYVKANPNSAEQKSAALLPAQPDKAIADTNASSNAVDAPKPSEGNGADAAANGTEMAELQGSLRRMNLLREHLPGVPLGWCFLHKDSDPKAVTRVGEHKATCWPDLVHPTTGLYQVSLAGTDPRIVDLSDRTWWIWKILGLFATALAISQGAPFWFDLLQKVVNLRLAGVPPPTTATEAKK